jgi:hypothetical protein
MKIMFFSAYFANTSNIVLSTEASIKSYSFLSL